MAEGSQSLTKTVEKELRRERGRNVLRMQLIRVTGINAAFAVALYLGLVKSQPDWAIILPSFTAWWGVSLVLVIVAWKTPGYARAIGWLGALVDFPVVYFLQHQ